ncbi:MAG: L,D-transpeptidase family protein [Chloroflexi bacterium]|nr:L,D-transpeptidase family protein [Chloroflexota bacterium]
MMTGRPAWWQRLLVAAALLPLLWLAHVPGAQAAEPWTGQVATDAVNVRSAPTTTAAVQDVLLHGATVHVAEAVEGEAIAGRSTWYRLVDSGYVFGVYIVPLTNPGPGEPPGTASGERWIDVNLSTQQATAFEGDQPVHVAPVSTGKPGWETPTGTFRIWRRVFNETMDSATIGVPRDSPEGYFLDNIFFTQYFDFSGAALHYNWWAPRDVFGNRTSSHGCVGMDWTDAEFFWNFATIGTRVVIHN